MVWLRQFVNTNFPQVGFELRFLGLKAGRLPFEPPLLVSLVKMHNKLHYKIQPDFFVFSSQKRWAQTFWLSQEMSVSGIFCW